MVILSAGLVAACVVALVAGLSLVNVKVWLLSDLTAGAVTAALVVSLLVLSATPPYLVLKAEMKLF